MGDPEYEKKVAAYNALYMSVIDPSSRIKMAVGRVLGEKLVSLGWATPAPFRLRQNDVQENDDEYYNEYDTSEGVSNGSPLTTTTKEIEEMLQEDWMNASQNVIVNVKDGLMSFDSMIFLSVVMILLFLLASKFVEVSCRHLEFYWTH